MLSSFAPISILAGVALTLLLAIGKQATNQWTKINNKYHIITYGCADDVESYFYDDDEL